MFGLKYKMKLVNPEKNIVQLTPTLGTYVKAFLPSVVIWGGLALFMAFQNDKPISLLDDLDTEDPNDK